MVIIDSRDLFNINHYFYGDQLGIISLPVTYKNRGYIDGFDGWQT